MVSPSSTWRRKTCPSRPRHQAKAAGMVSRSLTPGTGRRSFERRRRLPLAPLGVPLVDWLGGCARAFFYAGARALLVSHWGVDSYAATRLTTATFEILRNAPKLGRAEALRRAMLAYLLSS